MADASIPPEVARHAPRIHLHPQEAYPPTHPDRWLETARLAWYEGSEPESVADPAGAFFSGGTHSGFTLRGHRLTDLTRAWQGSQRDSGFALTAGTAATFTRVHAPVPVFYDHVDGAYVTYWLFFPWSTVPRRIPGPPGLEGLEGGEAGAVDPNLAIEGLLEAYPELMEAARPPAGLELSPGDALRYLHNWMGPKWPVMHEGDWEGIAVSLHPGERHVAYFQHGGEPQQRPLADGERPDVYVALGSHASYPDLEPRSNGSTAVKLLEKLADGPTLEIELLDVRTMPWYGYGGAWGAPGRISDETGPLGPCDAKGPRPYALPG